MQSPPPPSPSKTSAPLNSMTFVHPGNKQRLHQWAIPVKMAALVSSCLVILVAVVYLMLKLRARNRAAAGAAAEAEAGAAALQFPEELVAEEAPSLSSSASPPDVQGR